MAQLEAERARLQEVIDCAPVPLIVGDLARGLARPNRAMRAWLGELEIGTVEEILAATHPDDQAEDLRLFTELLDGQRDSYEIEKRFVGGGRVHWGRLAMAMHRGSEPFTVAVVQDIGELKCAEGRLQTVTENLPVACLITGLADSTIRYANPAAGLLFDTPAAELIGAPARAMYDDPADREAIVRLLHEQGRVDGYEAAFTSPSGRHMQMSASLRLVEYEGEPCLMGVGVDVTSRHEALSELERTAAHRELLLQEVHHRVKNNLQVISSLLFLQGQSVDDPAMRRVFESNRARILAMAIVHDALSESECARMPIDTLVPQLTSDLLVAWSRDASIEVVHDLAPVELARDAVVPCMLVVNELVANAIKHAFGKVGGQILVELRTVDGQAVLCVEDDGVGIGEPPDLTGLGLSLVAALVEQVHGTFRIVRLPQGGTCCEVRFPLG